MFRLFLTNCKSELFGLVEGLLGKMTEGHEELQECSEHSDNGVVLTDGDSDVVNAGPQCTGVHVYQLNKENWQPVEFVSAARFSTY